MPNISTPPSATREPQLQIQVRGPAALVAAAPYLLPVSTGPSIVVAVVTDQSRLRALTGEPLPPFPMGASPEVCRSWADEIGRLAGEAMAGLPLRPDEAHAVVVRLPEGFAAVPDWFSERILAAAAGWSSAILDLVAAFGGRWRSLVCRDPACCPWEGCVVLDHPDAVAVAAELIGHGIDSAVDHPGIPGPCSAPALPTSGGAGCAEGALDDGMEDLLVDALAIAPAVERQLAALPVPADTASRGRLLGRAWSLLAACRPLTAPDQIALLGLAVERPGVRDALLVRMARLEHVGRADWNGWFTVLEDAATWLPEPHSAGAWCLAAACAWAQERPSEALECLDDALLVEPEHRMALLLQRLIEDEIGAGRWLSRMAGIAEDVCLAFDRPGN
jgi:hypothetical protein